MSDGEVTGNECMRARVDFKSLAKKVKNKKIAPKMLTPPPPDDVCAGGVAGAGCVVMLTEFD